MFHKLSSTQEATSIHSGPFFQPKLTVNTPGDAHEREADAVADQVMRMREGDAPILQRMPLTSVSGVMRKCSGCEEKEKEGVQRKETGGGDASGKIAPSVVSDVLSSGGGQPMESGTRQFMESRFGQDFSQVRVHTDARAAKSASAIQARAYTSGRDVVFGNGEYQPSTKEGQRLLAHELVHVGQQKGDEIKREVVNDKEKTMVQRDTHTQNEGRTSLKSRQLGRPLPYRESRELSDCLRIMGRENINYCNEEVLGERTDIPAVCNNVPAQGNPTVNNPAAANDCTPSTARAVVDWAVVSRDANTWGVCVRSLTLAGTINIMPWPNNPSSMTTPNTPNPVDGGNINNTAGSGNHWQHAIDDMADYDTAGSGGAGSDWHSLDASLAHEWAHWNIDYLRDSVNVATGGNWPGVNTNLNALRELKSNSATEADARVALTPRVDALISIWRTNTIRAWNAITNDTPGAGGAGYAAGMAVLNGLITNVRNYKDSKGW